MRLAAMVLLLVATAVSACGADSLTDVQLAWCRQNSSVAVMNAAIELGYTQNEMRVLFDEMQVTGWAGPESDFRYLRSCRHALGLL